MLHLLWLPRFSLGYENKPHTDDIRRLVRFKGSNYFRPGYIKWNFGGNNKAKWLWFYHSQYLWCGCWELIKTDEPK